MLQSADEVEHARVGEEIRYYSQPSFYNPTPRTIYFKDSQVRCILQCAGQKNQHAVVDLALYTWRVHGYQ